MKLMNVSHQISDAESAAWPEGFIRCVQVNQGSHAWICGPETFRYTYSVLIISLDAHRTFPHIYADRYSPIWFYGSQSPGIYLEMRYENGSSPRNGNNHGWTTAVSIINRIKCKEVTVCYIIHTLKKRNGVGFTWNNIHSDIASTFYI